MDQNLPIENQTAPQTKRKPSNAKLMKKIDQTVDIIASKAFESQQCDKPNNFYSNSMLCTARTTPQTQPFRARQNQAMETKKQPKPSSAQKNPKKVRKLEHQSEKQDTIIMSKTQGENMYTTAKQNHSEQQLFMTMQPTFFHNTLNTSANLFSSNPSTRFKGTLNIDRKWTFHEFLNNLYLEKAKDLKTKPNPQQQALFIDRYKEKFQCFSAKQLAAEVEHGRAPNCAIKEINAPGSDFSLNAIRCICEFMLSNKIIKICSSEIHTFSNVRTIILDKNPLGDEAVSILAQSMTYFKCLQKLSVVSINMSSKGAKQLMKGLMGLQQLKHVNFSSYEGLNRNRFGDSTKQIELILSDPNCSWQYINLSNSNIGTGGLSIIGNGITKSTQIKELLVAQNDIAVGDISYFLLRVKFSKLITLDLSNNQIGDQGFKLITEIIGCQYGHNSVSRSLKVLNLSGNQIRSYGIDFYCKNMFNNNALTQLYLANNQLSKGQLFFSFKYYISKNWTLKKLDLSNCFTDLEDLRHLFEGMEENRAVLELKVNENNFSVESFVALAKMLSTNKSLKVLELDCCNITDKFIEKSQKELKKVRNIEHINFNNNYISDKSGTILMEMVNKGKSITKLSFVKNCLGIKVQNDISAVFKANKNRKEHSKIDQKEMEYLKYVSEIQENSEESIKLTIEKLREKQQKAKLSSLVCEVVKTELEEQNYRKELQDEINRIKQLEQKLNKKTANQSHRNSLCQSGINNL